MAIRDGRTHGFPVGTLDRPGSSAIRPDGL